MTAPGGGHHSDLKELLRSLGREAILREAESAGLDPRGQQFKCPWCQHKPLEQRGRTAWIYDNTSAGEPRVQCGRCEGNGSLVDVLVGTRGWSQAEAIAHLRGQPAPAPRPLRLVKPEGPPGTSRLGKPKLEPREIEALWKPLLLDDIEGRRYLEERGLGEAVSMGLVRFIPPNHPDERMQFWWRDKRRLVALMKDVTGTPRGLQGRLIRQLKAGEDKRRKCISFKDTANKGAFFGAPEQIEIHPMVAVAEGLPDYLAIAAWARGHPVAVVGAAGAGALYTLAEELERCGVSVEGRVFALFVQNDDPHENTSLIQFERLGQLLTKRGARSVLCRVPDRQCKDVADWLQAQPDTPWPPPELARALGGDVDHDTPSTKLVVPARGRLRLPERIEVSAYGQDFASLVAILDHPVHRAAVTGQEGDFAFNEMSGELDFGGGELDETDVSTIRLNIQLHCPGTSGQPLKFTEEEIWKALKLLSKRKKVHRIRDYLLSLKPSGPPLLEEPLAAALGLTHPSLEAALVRSWFISAAARGIEPGCKVDTVLILVGDEGLHKTTLFKTLAGKELFTSSTVQVGEADGYSVLRHNWIVEWGELDSMRRARDQQTIRNFLSGEADFYRPKWGRKHERFNRSCVIVGTTNEEHFLQGDFNRRMWPVRISTIDYPWFRANRDELWAQAARLYLEASGCADCKPLLPEERCATHRWWLEGDQADQLRRHNVQFLEEDEWVSVLREWLSENSPKAMTVHRVLKDAIGKPPGQWIPGKDPARAAEALKALGWKKSPSRRFAGEVGSWWVPAAQLEPGPRSPRITQG
jgi:hypothetical protein